MAINTYSTLKAALARWMFRDDMADIIPDFIALAEAKINRDLILREFETVTSGAGESFPMPDDTQSVTRISVVGFDGRKRVIPYVTPANQGRYAPSAGTEPQAFIVEANTVIFMPPGASAAWEMVYYPAIPALSDDAPTNWLLTRSPDVYLFGALTEAEPYLYNEERMPMWQQKYADAVAGLMASDERQQFPQAGLQMRTDTQ